MKKFIYALSAVIMIVSCKKEEIKDYVKLTGKIENASTDSLLVVQNNTLKTIKVKTNGTFSDTLKVIPGNFTLIVGKERANLYLKNGFNLKLNVDNKAFNKTLRYSGNGENVNNYLAEKVLFHDAILNDDGLIALYRIDFEKELNNRIQQFLAKLSKVSDLDSTFVTREEAGFKVLANQLSSLYSKNHSSIGFKGKESPKFIDYENFNGGNTSLKDLLGKYVYIDLWATWCGPCKAEIPFLKRVEKLYHGKNITFVSISLDRTSAYETWRKMVEEKELSGVQLYAKGDEKFARDFKVSSIPRFILIDPKGKVVDANAPRPSNKKLIELFNGLNI